MHRHIGRIVVIVAEAGDIRFLEECAVVRSPRCILRPHIHIVLAVFEIQAGRDGKINRCHFAVIIRCDGDRATAIIEVSGAGFTINWDALHAYRNRNRDRKVKAVECALVHLESSIAEGLERRENLFSICVLCIPDSFFDGCIHGAAFVRRLPLAAIHKHGHKVLLSGRFAAGGTGIKVQHVTGERKFVFCLAGGRIIQDLFEIRGDSQNAVGILVNVAGTGKVEHLKLEGAFGICIGGLGGRLAEANHDVRTIGPIGANHLARILAFALEEEQAGIIVSRRGDCVRASIRINEQGANPGFRVRFLNLDLHTAEGRLRRFEAWVLGTRNDERYIVLCKEVGFKVCLPILVKTGVAKYLYEIICAGDEGGLIAKSALRLDGNSSLEPRRSGRALRLVNEDYVNSGGIIDHLITS